MSQTDPMCPASSPSCPEDKNISRKPIKPPTITPRRFKKFFTPAKTSKIERNVRTSRRALQDITNPPGKPRHSSQLSRLIGHGDDLENIPSLLKEARGSKRKLSFDSVESPLLSSPSRPEPLFLSSSQDNPGDSGCGRNSSAEPIPLQHQDSHQEEVTEDEDEIVTIRGRRDAIQPFHTLSRSSAILSNRLSGRNRRKEPKSSKIWQCETASFYSNSKDTYFCGSQAYGRPALPFSSASCNSEYSRRCSHRRQMLTCLSKLSSGCWGRRGGHSIARLCFERCGWLFEGISDL